MCFSRGGGAGEDFFLSRIGPFGLNYRGNNKQVVEALFKSGGKQFGGAGGQPHDEKIPLPS